MKVREIAMAQGLLLDSVENSLQRGVPAGAMNGTRKAPSPPMEVVTALALAGRYTFEGSTPRRRSSALIMSRINSNGITQNVTDWTIARRANNNAAVISHPSDRP